MKKILYCLFTFLVSFSFAFAATTVPWTRNGTNEYPLYIGDNVGIGTTSPFAPLSVVGNEQHYGHYYHFGSVPANNGSCQSILDTCLELWGNDNTVNGVQSGVGNSNAGSSAYDGFFLNNNLASSGDQTHFGFLGQNSSNYSDTTFGTVFAVPNLVFLQNTDGPLSFITSNTNSANNYQNFVLGGTMGANEVARFTTAGLGIGTTTPAAPLDIVSAAATNATAAIFASAGGNGTSNSIYLGASLDPTTRGTIIRAFDVNGGNGHDLAFYTNTSGATPAERMRITSTGLVGIGTNNPTVGQLQVVTATGGTNGIGVTGLTSGIAYASSNTTGTGFSALAVTSGQGANYTVSTSGQGVQFNTTSATLSTANALQETGTANMTVDYTGLGLGFEIVPTRNVAAAATRTTSGNVEFSYPTFSTSGAVNAINNQTGTTTVFGRTDTNNATGVSSSMSITAPLFEMSHKETNNTRITDTANLLDMEELATTSSGTTLAVTNEGTGNLATFFGNGNFGIGTSSPGTLLSLGNTGVNTINLSTVATSTFGNPIQSRCFSTDGITCLGAGGGGSGTTGQDAFYASNGTAVSATSTIFITPASQVGIGTVSPNNLLQINNPSANSNSFLQLTNGSTGSTATDGVILGEKGSGNDAELMSQDINNLIFGTGQVERMRIESAGNIDIGSTTPTASKLFVQNNFTDTDSALFSLASSTNSAGTAANTAFTVLNNGNVGINTPTPFYPLDILDTSGGANVTALRIKNRSTSAGTGSSIGFSNSTSNTALTGEIEDLTTVTSNQDMVFFTNNQGNLGEAFRATGTGNLSIGSSTPLANLTVQNNYGSVNSALFSVSSSTNSTGTTGSTFFTVLANGNVGIGTTTPWRALDVNGTVGFKGLTTSAGTQSAVLCLSSQNEVIADSVACIASARRYKQDISDFSPATSLSQILALQPVTYLYKPDFNGSLQANPNYSRQQLGLIADDVIQVNPAFGLVETASTTFEGKAYPAGTAASVDYNEVTAALVGAVQAQQKEIGSINPNKTLHSVEDTWQDLLLFLLVLYVLITEINKRRT